MKTGEGFLHNESWKYLKAILDDKVSYPSDSSLDTDLEKSLQEQLKEGIKVAITELGVISAANEDLLLQSIDLSPIDDSWDGDVRDVEDLTPSHFGLLLLLKNLVNNLPSAVLEILQEEVPEAKGGVKGRLDGEFDKPI